jgi:hypothetical protein
MTTGFPPSQSNRCLFLVERCDKCVKKYSRLGSSPFMENRNKKSNLVEGQAMHLPQNEIKSLITKHFLGEV